MSIQFDGQPLKKVILCLQAHVALKNLITSATLAVKESGVSLGEKRRRERWLMICYFQKRGERQVPDGLIRCVCIRYKFSKHHTMLPSFHHPLMLKPSAKTAMASPHTFCTSILLLLLVACSCRASLEQVVDPACPRAKPAAAVAAEDCGGGLALCQSPAPHTPVAVFPYDVDPMQFALNLEFTEAELFLHAAFGVGLDQIAPNLTLGGPPPIGAMKAKLDEVTWRVIAEFGLQEIGHIRAIQKTVGGIPRPKIDLSSKNFARVMDEAFGHPLDPPFDPYIDSLNFLLATYVIPYLGLNGYTGTNPIIDGYKTKRLLAGLLGVEAGQDAVIRALLFERRQETVPPYKGITVAEFTDRISAARNRLGKCGVKDEGLTVPPELSAEHRICTNVLSADQDSLSYTRTPAQLLRILYLSGSEHVPGGFYPEGANGKIARQFLQKPRKNN